MTLVFATNNSHKFKEASKILPASIKLLSLKDIDSDDNLPETGTTLQSNARQKARYVNEKFGVDCFADDTGLEVAALEGRPGVYSARYSGINANAESNIQKLLIEMKGKTDRRARFRTVITLFINGKEFSFEGSVSGQITETPSGSAGFGYDPVFIPDDKDKTFSEMDEKEKNEMSHRGVALSKLADFLATYK